VAKLTDHKHVLVRTLLYLHHQLERASVGADLSPSQYLLLHFLHEGPRLAADFAAVSGFRQPSVAAAVGILEQKGWIERYVALDDRRARFVRTTDQGRKAFDRYERDLSEHLGKFLGSGTVNEANEELRDFYDLWNAKRIARFEQWAKNQSARGKRQLRLTGAGR